MVSYRGTYATNCVAAKTRWQLSIDNAEKTALTNLLTDCPQVAVTVTIAPIGTAPPPAATTLERPSGLLAVSTQPAR